MTSQYSGKGTVFALVEESQYGYEGGDVKTLLVHASKDAAARAMRKMFDCDYNSFQMMYNMAIGEHDDGSNAVKGTPLQEYDAPELFVCETNAAGDPVFLSQYHEETGGESYKLSISAKTIQGPAAYLFDREPVKNLIISSIGVTRVLSEIISDYAVPSVFLFKCIETITYEGPAGSSKLIAMDGGNAPSLEQAEATIRDALAHSELSQRCHGTDAWILCQSFIDSEDAALYDENGICSVDSEFALNGALVSVKITYDDLGEAPCVVSEEFSFSKRAAGLFDQTILV
jgi:hypothetical protein